MSGKGDDRKKRTLAQHFFLSALVIPLPAPRQTQEDDAQGTPISPSALCGGFVREGDVFFNDDL